MIRLAILVFFASMVGFSAYAQNVEGTNRSLVQDVREVVFHYLHPIVRTLPLEEQIIADSITIQITQGGPFPGPQAGFDENGKPIILIPEIYLILQFQFVEALALSESPGNFYLPEWWINYALWRLPPWFDNDIGGYPKDPVNYFYGTDTESIDWFKERFGDQMAGVQDAALIDMLLHEIGHHVRNGFYDPATVSTSSAQDIEREADQFASDTFRGWSNVAHGVDSSNLIGRFASILFIFELKSFSRSNQQAGFRTHPELGSRIRDVIGTTDCLKSEDMLNLCRMMNARIVDISSGPRTMKHYLERASSGEVFALEKLAEDRLRKGDQAGFCEYVGRDTVSGRSNHINLYRGFCFQNGYLGLDLSHMDRLYQASLYYCRAKRTGWLEAKRAYEQSITLSGLPDFCEGG